MFFTPSLLRRQPRGACRHCHAMAGDPAAATWQGSLFAETVAETKEEMVGTVEFAELVASMEI